MEQEKIFNLQLIVQKLEEELTLYRNGTTATEFIEIINEKEAENKALKVSLEETNDKLKKLAKSSSEVISRYEVLQKDRDDLANRLQSSDKNLQEVRLYIKEQESDLLLKEADKQELRDEITRLNNASKVITGDLQSLTDDMNNRTSTIEKLQVRCASLVAEKSEKNRQLELEKSERVKQTKEIKVARLLIALVFHPYIH